MFPAGFLGTRADALMDFVILAFIVILPAIIWSWRQARARNYENHKKAQLTLAAILFVAVAIFEVDLKMSGGIFVLTEASIYAGTPLLNWTIYIHTAFAIIAALLWLVLVIMSLRKFENPPRPNAFSTTHKRLGKAGMITMAMAGLTAFPLYILGFAY